MRDTALARKIIHGQRGELRQAYREGQEDQLGALGLVLNAVVLCSPGPAVLLRDVVAA